MGNACSGDVQDEEVLRDELFEQYHTSRACSHMTRVLQRFNRDADINYESLMFAMVDVGLYHPFADSLHYLQNMRQISLHI